MRELNEAETALIGGGEMQGPEGQGCTEPRQLPGGLFYFPPRAPWFSL